MSPAKLIGMLVAHLSDPHVGPLPRLRPAEIFGKRALGLANWGLRRRFEHRPEILAALVADLRAQAPDHIVVTGDLVNVALQSEFAPARAFLALLGPPDRVSFVPGNHDAYVRRALANAGAHWREYMSGDDSVHDLDFPYLRRRGHVALIGVSTAITSPAFHATGRIGAEQLARLGRLLEALGGTGLFRIVMLHHPPAPFAGDHRKQLLDTDALRGVLACHGADLVLHGHSHRTALSWLPGPGAQIPLVGVPSASAVGQRDEAAGYNLYDVRQDEGGWVCDEVSRGVLPGSLDVHERGRRRLRPIPAQ